MKKLIHYQILPVVGYVAIWNSEEEYSPMCGVALDTSKAGCTPIKFVLTGLFNDGSTISCGLLSLNHFSRDCDNEELYLYKYLYNYIDIMMAKALVRGNIFENGFSEAEAKEDIIEKISEAEVKCEEGVIEYLKS